MFLMALGINHQRAGVDVRGKLVFDAHAAIAQGQKLVETGVVGAVVVLSTCNRTEFYCETVHPRTLHDMLIGHPEQDNPLVQEQAYAYEGFDAVQHLMRVTSSLNSLIVGEAEIMGQVKQAYAMAQAAGLSAKYLDRLFQNAFSVAKVVRARTAIGAHSISMAQLAAKLAQPIFSNIKESTVLLMGAGKLAEAIARQLCAMGVKSIMVANRSSARARAFAAIFAERTKTCGFSLPQIKQHLSEADIIISATRSPVPLLMKEPLIEALRLRKRKPMVMLDLGVPRNIDAAVADLEDIYLYCMDDLHGVLTKHQALRQAAADSAEAWISDAATAFMQWFQAQDSFKTVAVFRGKFELLRDQLLADSLDRLERGHDPAQTLQRLAYHLTNQFLHAPTHRLRAAGLSGENHLLTFIKELFELNHEIIPAE
jgi:glutamyl-tRNA reductase